MTTNRAQKVLAIALLLGGAAAMVGYYSLTAVSARASSGAGTNFKDVVVTATDLTFGVKLEKTMLRVVRYPKDAVPLGSFSTVDSVVGQTTKVFMGGREAVTATKLSSRGGGLSMLVHPSMRAASCEVNAVSGVSGFVLPGDRVDVLNTVDGRGSNAQAITKTVLQNVEVLAAGQKTQQGDNKPLTVQSVTLLVDPTGAEILAHAQHEGQIHLVLRNPEDQEQVVVNSVSTSQLMSGGGPPVAAAGRPASKPAPPKPPAAFDPGVVRIIRAAQVTETPAVVDSIR